MQKPLIRLILLMLIMLNHAVSACESLVMHLPDENHPFSVLEDSSHQQLPPHQHQQSHQVPDAAQTPDGVNAPSSNFADDSHHSTHAHVSCFISSIHFVNADPVVHKPVTRLQYALITTSYAPAVPPPNL